VYCIWYGILKEINFSELVQQEGVQLVKLDMVVAHIRSTAVAIEQYRDFGFADGMKEAEEPALSGQQN
jgi:hypothetical protein